MHSPYISLTTESMVLHENPNMATDEAKRARLEETRSGDEMITIQFETENGERPYSTMSVPLKASVNQLEVLVKHLLKEEREKNYSGDGDEDDLSNNPFLFYLGDHEIKSTVEEALNKVIIDREKTLPVIFKPQAIFKVHPVSRCTSSMPGHSEAVVAAHFSPNGQNLATGSGDRTVRFWDLSTQTPKFECKGHEMYVLTLSWAPDGTRIASGDRKGVVIVWEPDAGPEQKGKRLIGHSAFITGINWKPLHLCDPNECHPCRHLASSSKDCSVRLWDVLLEQCLRSLTSHTASVTSIRWSGLDLIYSGSHDRTIKVWRANDGVLCRTLQGHGHWVNAIALNTDYVLRTAFFEPALLDKTKNLENKVTVAKKRYDAWSKSMKEELMVSGSDDYSLFLWKPSEQKTSINRLTGHQQLVNDVKFSPDGRFLASASFDKSIRIWNGRTGSYLGVLRGHVQSVYQLAWSADSRLLVSASKDSTIKLWSVLEKRLKVDLPGHGDEVYAVDWAPDGQCVASGGRDKVVRLWKR